MRLLCRLFLAIILLAPAGLRAEPAPSVTDVRVLIDISGSMVETDPQNRRTPAVNLLIDSLPEGSRAGIWSFGRYVNLLVEHETVDAAWRERAEEAVATLEPIAQWTNLGAVLDDAGYDFGYSSYEPPTDVVLITDGQVDIAANSDVNQVERDRILDTVIPRFAGAGARIHSLALTDAADAGLLEQMSTRTGGVFERVESADDIQSFVLNVLQDVTPGNEVPLEEGGFDVDGRVSEVTALVMHETGQLGLRAPDGEDSSALTPRPGQQWRVGPGYTLVTVAEPQPGHWQIAGEIGDGSRVSVVSDLNLRWQRPSGSVVLREQPLLLELEAVDETGEAVPAELTDIMTPTLSINGEPRAGLRWSEGMLRARLPNNLAQGPVELEVRVDGGTFQRLVRRTVQNQPALTAEVLVVDGGYQWRLYPSHRDLQLADAELEARIDGPEGVTTRPFERHPSGYFRLDLGGDVPDGTYELTAEGRLSVDDRPVASLGVAPVTLTLPVDPGQPRILDLDAEPAETEPEPETEAQPEPEPEPEPAAPFVKEPMPPFEEISAQMSATQSQPGETAETAQEPPSEAEVETGAGADWEEEPAAAPGTPWLTYLLYSLPGLVVLVGFFLFYRALEKRGQPEKEDLLAPETELAPSELDDFDDLDLSAGFGSSDDSGPDEWDGEAPLMEDEVTAEPQESDQDPGGGAADNAEPELDSGEGDDLFDLSNVDDNLSELEGLSLDENDPFGGGSESDEDDEDARQG